MDFIGGICILLEMETVLIVLWFYYNFLGCIVLFWLCIYCMLLLFLCLPLMLLSRLCFSTYLRGAKHSSNSKKNWYFLVMQILSLPVRSVAISDFQVKTCKHHKIKLQRREGGREGGRMSRLLPSSNVPHSLLCVCVHVFVYVHISPQSCPSVTRS